MTVMAAPRSLSTIAADVEKHWASVNYAARPYLDAMRELNTIRDVFYADSASSVVAYFLSNATSWHGDDARRIKKELNTMLKKAF